MGTEKYEVFEKGALEHLINELGYNNIPHFTKEEFEKVKNIFPIGKKYAIINEEEIGLYIKTASGITKIAGNTALPAPTTKEEILISNENLQWEMKDISNIDFQKNKMDKVNPTGTGSFSLNRKAGSTVGSNSFAEGNNCEASGGNSHAEGYFTRALDYDSHAEGNSTLAGKSGAHAEGNATYAIALFAHAEGQSTHAEGDYSHSEGQGTFARGDCSHSEGNNTYAKKHYSHAEGAGTLANTEAQHVQGKYNIEDTENKYAHIVGNGTFMTRANAHTLDWSGNAWFSGSVSAANGFDLSSNTAADLDYDSTSSGLAAKNIQEALDEINLGLFKIKKSATYAVQCTTAGSNGHYNGSINLANQSDYPSNVIAIIPINARRTGLAEVGIMGIEGTTLRVSYPTNPGSTAVSCTVLYIYQ